MGTKGIGSAIARSLLAGGTQVVLAGRGDQAGKAALDELDAVGTAAFVATGHGEDPEGNRGDAAGAQLGADPAERFERERGNRLAGPLPGSSQLPGGEANRRPGLAESTGGPVGVRERTARQKAKSPVVSDRRAVVDSAAASRGPARATT